MLSTNSSQLQPHDAERDFIDCVVTRPADRDHIRRDLRNQFYPERNHQPTLPSQDDREDEKADDKNADDREDKNADNSEDEKADDKNADESEDEEADDSEDEYWKYIPLHKAAVEGDWAKAKKFFEKNPDAVTANINSYLETALHVAVEAGHKAIDFVKNLVEEMPIEALEHRNNSDRTALGHAAMVGNKRAAEILVRKHPGLLYIPDKSEDLPVHLAATCDHKDTFQYLLSVTEEVQGGFRPFADRSGVSLLNEVISSGYYDEALQLIERYPELTKLQTPEDDSALSAIASKASAFPSGSHLSFWEYIIYSCVPVKLDKHVKQRGRSDIEDPVPKDSLAQTFVQRLHAMLYKALAFLVPPIKRIGDKKQQHHQAERLVKLLCQQVASLDHCKSYRSIVKGPLLTAAKSGVKEVVEEILDLFPQAVWFSDDKSHSVFELAILYRHEKVFNIIYRKDQCKYILPNFKDKKKNNILHLAARLSPEGKLNRIPGAALQMQRELQWYKEIEKFVRPKNKLEKNKDKKIPEMLFTEEHRHLVLDGEKWMKDAANSCTIVASLIATIAFAAAITVPGGNDNVSGLPIFSKKSAFFIFAISNALSLFTSATSLLMFLSILTSRYEESDFLYVLPRRLIIGLVTLFLSITTMMVAFTAILYLVAGKYKEWILIPAAGGASVLIYIFPSLQFPLLLDLVRSTYSTIFGKKNDRPIF